MSDDARAAYETYRAEWRRFFEPIAARLQTLDPAIRVQAVRVLGAQFPALFSEPDFQRLATRLGVATADLTPSGVVRDEVVRDEEVALTVLRELAAWYRTPGVLTGREAIVGFVQKIQDALDALFAGYVPLRDGLRKFEAEFDVDHSAAANVGAHAVAQARTPLDVGARALDWTDPVDGARAFRSVFADSMIHNISLLNGVMKGAAALLNQLSPGAIAETFETAKRAGRVGFALGPYRFRELWRVFERRHQDFAQEERETFALLFGREFAQTYQQLFSNVADDANEQAARNPPRRRASAPPPAAQTGNAAIEDYGARMRKNAGPTGTIVVPRAPALPPDAAPPNARSGQGNPPPDDRRRGG